MASDFALEPETIQAADLATLANADPNPIRTIGHIQPHGLLLVFQISTRTILQVSNNFDQILGLAPEELLSQPLAYLFPADQVEALLAAIELPQATEQHHLPLTPHRGTASPIWLEGSLYQNNDIAILELEPLTCDKLDDHLQQNLQLQSAMAALRSATSVIDLAQHLVQVIQSITGFDRVMVYQFKADHSGMVIAEAKQPDLAESYLGLHYPATDIPTESRQLFYQNPLRVIPAVTYAPAQLIPPQNPLTQAPLDLGQTALRGVSPPHVKYLQNMGVAASITLSLIHDQGLWGLVACHHYQPKSANLITRQLITVLARVAGLELMRQQTRQLNIYLTQNRALQAELRAAISQEDAVQRVLADNADLLMNLFEAQGLALLIDRHCLRFGQTPNRESIQTLGTWLQQQDPETVFATDCLAEQYAPDPDWPEQISGVLGISILLKRRSQPVSYHLLLFRLEQPQLVNWAGKLSSSIQIDAAGQPQLCPRHSFQLWQQTVRGRSLPWQPQELEAALDLRNTLLLTVLEFSRDALEEVTHRAEAANRAKSEFLANMSHEIRTPMNAVLGFTDLLQSLVEDPIASNYIQAISTSGKTLLTLINDILDFSKIEAGRMELHPETTHLSALVQDIKQIFQQTSAQKGVPLVIDLAPDLPPTLLLDADRLRQILFNLVSNALKFTERGQVIIQMRCVPVTPPRPGLTTLILAVTDTGIGIPVADQKRVFQSFTQQEGQSNRKYGGTGLGLAITDRLVRLMGGSIYLKSQPGQGSTFTCRFPNLRVGDWPSAADIPAHPQVSQDNNLDQFNPLTILVADDVQSNRELITAYFQSTAHRLLLASNGQEALQCVYSHTPDLILLDVRMPGMDGQQVAQTLKADPTTRMIPIIIVTASSSWDKITTLEETFAAICEGLLHKPVKQSQLVAAMRQVLPHHLKSPLPFTEPTRPSIVPQLLQAQQLALHKQLSQIAANQWQPLSQTLGIDELEQFIASLQQAIEQYPYVPLIAYLQTLRQQYEDFDGEGLTQTLARFPELLTQLNPTRRKP